jgi:hypothetical protein
MKKIFAPFSILLLILGLGSSECRAWDYEGHRLVNQLALASLPTNFPAFVLTSAGRERVAFLAGEPDRWRNTPDLGHFNGPDHYIDLDELEPFGLDMHSLTHFRYDFTAQLALARAAHPDRFPPIDPDANFDHTRQLVGFLPWAIAENYDKLKSGFSYLKTFAEDGTPEEIANAQQNILYIMGVMGHYVGDASQPLHTTKHHHGWVGENPNQYKTDKGFHSWIDGGYFHKIGGVTAEELRPRIQAAQSISNGKVSDPFPQVLAYIIDQHKLVEPLYKLDKEGKLSGEGEVGHEGKAFLTAQIVIGGQELGNLWFTAWQQAAPDTFLKSSLAKRKLASGGNSKH